MTVRPSSRALAQQYPAHSDADRIYSPANWGYTIAHPQQAYQAECATLGDYDAAYGEGTGALWIRMQVLALYGSSSCRDAGVADGIALFSDSFAGQTGPYKLTELMLFFARYRAGQYDDSFASFDSRRIGVAWRSYLRERNSELDRLYRRKEQEAIEARRAEIPEGYSSLTWYQELQRRAAGGDAEAKKILHN